MNDQNQIGAGLALIFAIIGFIIALYDILAKKKNKSISKMINMLMHIGND